MKKSFPKKIKSLAKKIKNFGFKGQKSTAEFKDNHYGAKNTLSPTPENQRSKDFKPKKFKELPQRGEKSGKFFNSKRKDDEDKLKKFEVNPKKAKKNFKLPASSSIIKIETIVNCLEQQVHSLTSLLTKMNLPLVKSKELTEVLNQLINYKLVTTKGKLYKLRSNFLKNSLVPEVAVLTITSVNSLGEYIAVFSSNTLNKLNLAGYQIYIASPLKNGIKVGDKIIAKLKIINHNTLVAKILKPLPKSTNNDIIGLVSIKNGNYFLNPLGRKFKVTFLLNTNNQNLPERSLVKANIISLEPTPTAGLTEIISKDDISSNLSLLTAREFNLKMEFGKEALAEANNSPSIDLKSRVDLRNLPLVTIDGEDAKDFDDAVYVQELPNDEFKAIIAIADVSFYVKENTELDKEALERGNSVYLPGLVIPMLPEILSNGLCSLNPEVDRAVIAAELIINKEGNIKSYNFYKAVINSKARLTYNEVENALNGTTNSKTNNILKEIINPLFNCWKVLNQAKIKRHALEITSTEYKIDFDSNNQVKDIIPKKQLTSHKIIEELMIAANVAAATFLAAHGLESKKLIIYRVHDKPSLKKIENLQAILYSLKIKVKIPANVTPAFFNSLLESHKNSPLLEVLNETILMSQSQALYDNNNIGHFGLALSNYCHFTSPIRRYADLTVHRLISKVIAKNTKNLPLKDEVKRIAEHISATEKNAAAAEYSSVEKIIAGYLEAKIGCEFSARITTITNAGLFITLPDLGASGLIPMRMVGDERFIFKENSQEIIGQKSRKTYRIGQRITAVLIEANVLRGQLTFNLK